MKQEIKPIRKSFDQIVKSVAKYNPNPDKKLKPIKKFKQKSKKK